MERSNLTFLKQAARGARPERGEPIAPHPTTRGQFQRTHPRGRAWPGGGARSLLASYVLKPLEPPFAFWSAGRGRRTALGRYWSRLSLVDPPTHLLVSFAHVLIHSAPPTPLPISFTHARSALRLEPLVSPSRARRSAGCVWCTTHAGRSDCTPPNDACVVPMHPPATACVAGGPSTLSVSIFTGADDGTRVSVPPGTKARSRIDAQQVGVQVWSVGAPMCPGDESGTVAPPPYFAKRPLTCSMLCHPSCP